MFSVVRRAGKAVGLYSPAPPESPGPWSRPSGNDPSRRRLPELIDDLADNLK